MTDNFFAFKEFLNTLPQDKKICAGAALEFLADSLGEEYVEAIGYVMNAYVIEKIASKLERFDNEPCFDWMKSGHDYALAIRTLAK